MPSRHPQDDTRSRPRFRAIAIAGDEPSIDRIVALAGSLGSVALGVMLRDPRHRPERVASLARHLLAAGPPENLEPITNAHPAPGIGWLHRTAAQLAELPAGVAPAGLRFGASTHSTEEALEAERLGASYITFGPVFATPSKPGHPGVGLKALGAVCGAVCIPVFALGGIAPGNALLCREAGAHGIASISLFSACDAETLGRLLWGIDRRAR